MATSFAVLMLMDWANNRLLIEIKKPVTNNDGINFIPLKCYRFDIKVINGMQFYNILFIKAM